MQRALLAIAFLAGCKSDEVTQLETVKKEVCACKDLRLTDTPREKRPAERIACGEAGMKKLPKKDHTAGHREQQLAKDIHNCLARLYDEDRPSTDPDQPQDGSDGSGSAAPKK
jgi:hypothetical protein